jgi:hypothetical protein
MLGEERERERENRNSKINPKIVFHLKKSSNRYSKGIAFH